MGNGNTTSLSRFIQIDGAGSTAVSVDNAVFRMLPEETSPPRAIAAKIVGRDVRSTINRTAQGLDLLVIIADILRLLHEVILKFRPIDGSQQIHQQRFRAAAIHSSHHVENLDWSIHVNHLYDFRSCLLLFAFLKFARTGSGRMALTRSSVRFSFCFHFWRLR